MISWAPLNQIHGFVTMCQVRKSLYGLRQAPRTWYHTLSQSLLKFIFHQLKVNNSLFIFRCMRIQLFFLVYVDNIILTGSSPIIDHHKSSFVVKDLSTLTYFLGIEVVRCREGLLLYQHKYTTDLLVWFDMSGAKPVATLISTSKHLSILGDVDPMIYRSAIGGL